ncbi:MAG TPA: right-handed parallel beta-helix repeat-containing protein [Stellaceae bacterium]|jgi:hypothetical protein|nr:right-handed parallel beta-helix repeat-containing protein [Stellaceae bacterium]
MNRTPLFAVIAATAMLILPSAHADAHIYGLTCSNSGSDNLQGALTGGASWTAIDGGAGGAATVAPGDIVELTRLCQGDVLVAKNGLPITGVTITNSTDSETFGSDGINGQVEVKNAQLTLQGLVLESGQNGDVMTNGEVANVFAHDGASVTLSGDSVEGGPLIGVYILRGSSGQILSTTVDSVGASNIAKEDDGIRIEGSSTAVVARSSGPSTTISNNGGNGISLVAGSSLELFDSTVQDNAGVQIFANNASTAHINASGVTITTSPTLAPLIEAFGASSVTIDGTSFVQDQGGNAPAALLVAGASSAVLNAATLSTTGVVAPVAEASANSSLILAGGNSITATGANGMAVQIDHSSSLLHQQGTFFGYSDGAESVSGRGAVLVQSSIELGQGPVASGFGMVWNGGIAVGQNSALRMQSGVHVTGAVQISAASNGYFNCNNNGNSCSGTGAQNEIDGTVECLELVASPDNPSVHVSNPQLIVNSSQAAGSGVVGPANLFGPSSFANTSETANTCLNF